MLSLRGIVTMTILMTTKVISSITIVNSIKDHPRRAGTHRGREGEQECRVLYICGRFSSQLGAGLTLPPPYYRGCHDNRRASYLTASPTAD